VGLEDISIHEVYKAVNSAAAKREASWWNAACSEKGAGARGRVRRVVKEVENLCAYEGAEFVPLRASGKVCPRCGVKSVEVKTRIFKCPQCGLTWHRDRCATIRLALIYADRQNHKLKEALLKWVEEHPRALLS